MPPLALGIASGAGRLTGRETERGGWFFGAGASSGGARTAATGSGASFSSTGGFAATSASLARTGLGGCARQRIENA
ncbi:MAG TPA: hypothetical protein VGK73_10605, partial [Polyangiaceae bacterium]